MNIINAIFNVVTGFSSELNRSSHGLNRANQMGGALEEWVKDIFANTAHIDNEQERLFRLSQVFSYLGNQNNPPDIILRSGDAIEVKKVTSKDATLALNSSYPKNKLFANSPLITQACRQCEENWTQKDILYIVGVVPKSQTLHSLFMVYGEDYCADPSTYERIRQAISTGIQTIPDIEFTSTNELAKVKKVDPLGITDLRVRGMWSITSPFKVFDYIYQRDFTKSFNFACIINQEKYQSFNNTFLIENLISHVDGFNIQDVYIKNPNNPAQLKLAKLISFKV
ncbi:NgoPII family restriction endonuclease [Moraxella canis]|uniref:Restriction endonuclease n=1 Tax=Moraxella canis TaxID=90239 RepID=A0A1S9ZJJ7_9GAMM|nr:NgoPII family restriction endonuclease [Moraxella canis]OOR83457.1 restriction endonuclease [Moraxella canis]